MSDQVSLEQRLAALENEVARIKRRLGRAQPNGNWVDEIAGSMAPFPEFEEVVRLGRKFRESVKEVDELRSALARRGGVTTAHLLEKAAIAAPTIGKSV